MSVKRTWQGTLVVGFTLVAAGCGAGSAAEADASEAGNPPALERRIVPVEVYEVRPEPFTDVVNIVGMVEANRDVTLAAEEGGVVREVLADKGTFVRAGQPILRIDDSLLAPQVEQAEADAALAREMWERQKKLWEEEKIGTELAYLQARYAAQRAEANHRFLAERLSRTTIRAPLSGILESRLVEVGAMVSPGTPVARLVDVNTVKVRGGVPERYASDIEKGSPAVIRFDLLGGREFAGRIDFVGATVDPRDRTVPVEVVVRNPDGAIKPGMVATVSIVRHELDGVVAVPQEAVLRTETGYVVFIASGEGGQAVAESRPVVMGPTRNNRVVIESGLEPGDRVIVVGQLKVAAGDRLRIVEREEGTE